MVRSNEEIVRADGQLCARRMTKWTAEDGFSEYLSSSRGGGDEPFFKITIVLCGSVNLLQPRTSMGERLTLTPDLADVHRELTPRRGTRTQPASGQVAFLVVSSS